MGKIVFNNFLDRNKDVIVNDSYTEIIIYLPTYSLKEDFHFFFDNEDIPKIQNLDLIFSICTDVRYLDKNRIRTKRLQHYLLKADNNVKIKHINGNKQDFRKENLMVYFIGCYKRLTAFEYIELRKKEYQKYKESVEFFKEDSKFNESLKPFRNQPVKQNIPTIPAGISRMSENISNSNNEIDEIFQKALKGDFKSYKMLANKLKAIAVLYEFEETNLGGG